MLLESIKILLSYLNQYIAQADGGAVATSAQAVWGNIAQLDRPEVATELENHIILTLVNLQEEATLKNGPVSRHIGGTELVYMNPPIHLNLLLLFTSNYRNYETALKRLAQVISYFQGKKIFGPRDFAAANPNTLVTDDFSMIMDLVSLSYEEVNHLWGSLGGRQLPFVVYRGRLVAIMDRRTLDGGGRILEIGLKTGERGP